MTSTWAKRRFSTAAATSGMLALGVTSMRVAPLRAAPARVAEPDDAAAATGGSERDAVAQESLVAEPLSGESLTEQAPRSAEPASLAPVPVAPPPYPPVDGLERNVPTDHRLPFDTSELPVDGFAGPLDQSDHRIDLDFGAGASSVDTGAGSGVNDTDGFLAGGAGALADALPTSQSVPVTSVSRFWDELAGLPGSSGGDRSDGGKDTAALGSLDSSALFDALVSSRPR